MTPTTQASTSRSKCDECGAIDGLVWGGFRPIPNTSFGEEVYLCNECSWDLGACARCQRFHARKTGYGSLCRRCGLEVDDEEYAEYNE